MSRLILPRRMKYPGGIISASPIYPTLSEAKGVWTPEEAMQAMADGNWPLSLTPLTYAYGGKGSDGGNTASPNWGSIPAANPAADRYIIAVACLSNNNLNNSVTAMDIAGGAAVKLHEYDNRPGGADGGTVSFWYRAVPTGTTVTVTGTLSSAVGSNRGSACFVHEVFGLTSAPVLADSADDNDNNVDDSVALNIDCPAFGVIIGGAAGQGRGTQTWNNITKRDELDIGLAGDSGTGGLGFETAQTNLAVSFSNDGAGFIVGSAISIGPST